MQAESKEDGLLALFNRNFWVRSIAGGSAFRHRRRRGDASTEILRNCESACEECCFNIYTCIFNIAYTTGEPRQLSCAMSRIAAFCALILLSVQAEQAVLAGRDPDDSDWKAAEARSATRPTEVLASGARLNDGDVCYAPESLWPVRRCVKITNSCTDPVRPQLCGLCGRGEWVNFSDVQQLLSHRDPERKHTSGRTHTKGVKGYSGARTMKVGVVACMFDQLHALSQALANERGPIALFYLSH